MGTSPERAKDLLEVTECFSVGTQLRAKHPGSNPSALTGIPLPSKEIQSESHLLSWLLVKALLPSQLPDPRPFFGKD